MMMYEENARKLNTVFVSLGAQDKMKVIPIGAVDSLIADAGTIRQLGQAAAAMAPRMLHVGDRLARFLEGILSIDPPRSHTRSVPPTS